jgi:dolichol kinase
MQTLFVLGLAAKEAGLLSGARDLSNLKPVERNRRLVHLGFGACALLIPVLGRWGSAAVAAAALLYNGVVAPRLGLDRGYRRPGDGSWNGLVTYPLAVLLLVVLCPPLVAAGAWVVLAAADPVAAAVGTRFPAPRVPGNPRKSLAGAAAGFVAAVAACAGVLGLLGAPAVFLPAAAAAAAGSAAEVVPVPGDDNLAIAAAAALALLAWFG